MNGEGSSRVFRVAKSFTFSAAHYLPSLPPTHKCSRLHGHTYTVEVEASSASLTGPGFVVDFADLAVLGHYLATTFDHRCLNEVLDLEPTCEKIAEHLLTWCQHHVEPDIRGAVTRVRVSESPTSWGEVAVSPVSATVTRPAVLARSDDSVEPAGVAAGRGR